MANQTDEIDDEIRLCVRVPRALAQRFRRTYPAINLSAWVREGLRAALAEQAGERPSGTPESGPDAAPNPNHRPNR